MTSVFLFVAAFALQGIVTQPPAEELLDNQGFAAALAELEKSPRVRLETIGWSHQGRPVVLIIVGESEVMSNLDQHRRRAYDIAGPLVEHPTLATTRVDKKPLETLLTDIRLPVLAAGDSWGHEAAQVEGLIEAARTLAFDDTEEVHRALSHTLALLIPLMNPDGREAAIEEWKRTPLSNGDSGVGNAYGFLLNRDFVHGTQPESRAILESILKWRPVVVIDQHEDMYNLGVRHPEVCFVEPFVPGFDIEEHPLTRAATVTLGKAIAERWRRLGFNVLFNEEGDDRFAPIPERGRGLNPVAGSAGRLNLMSTTHGIVSFITESARTPGSQSWEDRVAQKASSVMATLLEVSAHPERYARAVSDRRFEEAKEGGNRFVAIPEEGQAREALEDILDQMKLHELSVYHVDDPYPAFVIPLAQAEARAVRHLLLAERSKLNQFPPALGVKLQTSDSLPESARKAFLAAELHPANLRPVAPPSKGHASFTAEPGVSSTALVNRLLSSGAATAYQAGEAYLLEGQAETISWHASLLGVALEAAPKTPRPALAPLRLPRVAIYSGQGIPISEWGEIAWALEQAGFPYRIIDEDGFYLDGVDVLIMPNGSAPEIVAGWDPGATGRRSPWEPAEPSRGIGPDGMDAIRSFVNEGGTYVGLGSGGAFLAGYDYLGLTDAEMVPSNVGLGQVRLRLVDPSSRLFFGYSKDESVPAYFYGPPGTPERGFAFRAGDSTVAAYEGVREFEDEQSFVSTEVLSAASGNAAIVYEEAGRGRVVLFGIAPVFRGQWRSSFRLLYNAIYLSTETSR